MEQRNAIRSAGSDDPDPCRNAIGLCFVRFCRDFPPFPQVAAFRDVLEQTLGSATVWLVYKHQSGSATLFSERQEDDQAAPFWQVDWDGSNYLLPQPRSAVCFEDCTGFSFDSVIQPARLGR